MGYIAPRDYSQDPDIIAKVMRTMEGHVDLEWMKNIRERAAFRPALAGRGLTLDDVNRGGYGPDQLPERVRHNFSMAPRGAILPPGLPSLGYRVNRKSDVWSDLAPALFEECKSRRWAPARDVPWSALDAPGHPAEAEAARRQLATGLVSVGLVCADVAASWVYRINQEFHEVKYLLCAQMFDAARVAEAFRKRALYGEGALGVDSRALDELLKMVIESDTYPEASAAMNLALMHWVGALGRHWEFAATNAADRFLGTRLAQDAARFAAYGTDHVRALLRARPVEGELLSEHLDQVENGLVGALGAPEVIEPLALMSGRDLRPVVRLYARAADEYFERCAAAGLSERRARSPLPAFLRLLRGEGSDG